MIAEAWNRLSPHARRHFTVAAIGFVLGATFGDLIFVVVELVIGDPWDELVFGIGGAAVASIAYEFYSMARSSS